MSAAMDDAEFCKRLPKTELHAHLTGSILPVVLREIWLERKAQDPEFDLGDPVELLDAARKVVDADSFFPLFGKIIYRLCNTKSAIQRCAASVLADFAADGVQHLELRTIPRTARDLATKAAYVETVLESIRTAPVRPARTYLILSVDRKNTAAEALETVDLAIRYRPLGVVGVDLAGDPALGDVSLFRPAFARARAAGLKITLHFAEIEYSSRDEELRTLLSYSPDRLGHVIRVPDWAKEEIVRRKLGVELCLTCNVDGRLTDGGFAAHHFGWWRGTGCPVAICTDDVGIFRSRSSDEHALLMRHFGLSRSEVLAVARSSVACTFGTDEDKRLLERSLDAFERQLDI